MVSDKDGRTIRVRMCEWRERPCEINPRLFHAQLSYGGCTAQLVSMLFSWLSSIFSFFTNQNSKNVSHHLFPKSGFIIYSWEHHQMIQKESGGISARELWHRKPLTVDLSDLPEGLMIPESTQQSNRAAISFREVPADFSKATLILLLHELQ